jgi:hypothetical protein
VGRGRADEESEGKGEKEGSDQVAHGAGFCGHSTPGSALIRSVAASSYSRGAARGAVLQDMHRRRKTIKTGTVTKDMIHAFDLLFPR